MSIKFDSYEPIKIPGVPTRHSPLPWSYQEMALVWWSWQQCKLLYSLVVHIDNSQATAYDIIVDPEKLLTPK